MRRREVVQSYRGHTGAVRVAAFSPDGRWVVSGGDDGVVTLWDLTAGKRLHQFTTHTGPITTLQFNPHDFYLATASADRTVKLWDLEVRARACVCRLRCCGTGDLVVGSSTHTHTPSTAAMLAAASRLSPPFNCIFYCRLFKEIIHSLFHI